MTVIIPYTGNKTGLAALLVMLQPQLHPDSDIYIIDSSKEKSAKQIVLLYGSTRCYIFVEPTDKTGSEAIRFGLESMKQNKQDGALILYENCVISTTFISNLKKAMNYDDWSVLMPQVSESIDKLDPNFKWYSPPTTTVTKVDPSEELLIGIPFYIKSSVIGDDYKVDFIKGINAGQFINELVTVFL